MDEKIRVLRIIGECKTGGTETIALNYYENLDHGKIAMDFLFFGESLPRFSRELEANGDKVINVAAYSENLIQSIRQIKEAVRKGNYDIVHSQLNALNFFPLLGAWLGGAKIRVAANHSTANLKYERKKSLLKYLLRPTARLLATDYAACSNYAGAWCFGKKAQRDGKIKIIRNAIDLTKFEYSHEIREKVRYEMNWDGRFVIGHCGRFTEQKNHGFSVDIFREIHERCPQAILVFIGEGHLMDSVKEQVAEYGLNDSVQFLGVRFDVNQLMQGMDVFLFPSLYEGLGNVITEAQAVGLQSVVSDVVPNEVKLTELVEFVPLKETAAVWAERVLSYNNGYVRYSRQDALIKEGYEIQAAAKDLENYYRLLMRKHK